VKSLITDLYDELSIPHVKPLVLLMMKMHGWTATCRANRVVNAKATAGILAGHFADKFAIEEMQRFSASIRPGVHTYSFDRLIRRLTGNTHDVCHDMIVPPKARCI
jgi:hypothetical protein